MTASSAPALLPDAVSLWRHAIEALPAERPPCRHLSPTRWAEIRDACLDFCDRWGSHAHQLGWTAPQLFGVHPEHGTLRPELCGALMVNGHKATGVEAGRIMLGNQSARRDKPGQAWGLPIWEFAARER